MAITVLLHVYHQVQQRNLLGPPPDVKVVVPNVDPSGTVGEQVKSFVQERLGVPIESQELTAPLSEELADSQPATYLPHAFLCEPSSEVSQLYIDEDSLSLWGVHLSNQVELNDDDRLAEKRIVDQAVLRLGVLPQPLNREDGGRVFVETKSGVLPLLGIRPTTRVRFVKEMLFSLLGIPVKQQILSSSGRVMLDDQQMAHFEGLHAVHTDTVLDLCCVGEPLKDQSHRRMVVHVSILDGREVSVVVSGRDHVRDVMAAVENQTGLPADQQKVTFNGKTLEEGWLLKDVAVCNECTMHVASYSSLLRSISYGTSSEDKLQRFHPELVSPPREDGDTWGSGSGKKRRIKLMRVRNGKVVGTLRLSFCSGDTVADVRRRVGQFLRPHLESLDPNDRSRDSFDIPIKPRAPDITPRSVLRKSTAPSTEVQPLGTPSPPNKLEKLQAPILVGSEFSFARPPPSVLASEKSLGQSMSLSAWKRRQDRLDAMRRSIESVSAIEDESTMKVRDWLASENAVPEGLSLSVLPSNIEAGSKQKHRWIRAKARILRALKFRSGH